MKVGRNDDCPCGSGKKFKRCCLNEEVRRERIALTYLEDYRDVNRNTRIKQCLYPNHKECSEKIVKAHAIQNNRILTKLSVNGLLRTLDGLSFFMLQNSQEKGRKVATTFTGFCSYHDQHLFHEIEDKEFICTEKQLFLLAYRTFAWHYHKKLEQYEKTYQLHQRTVNNPLFSDAPWQEQYDFLHALSLALSDNDSKKSRFDQYLLSETYFNLNHSIWTIPHEIQIAASCMLEIEHDIKGKIINNLELPQTPSSIFLNIFPSNGKSFCIWSWFKEDESYKFFTDQFMDLSSIDKCNYLNNMLPRWSDAIVISPILWDSWGEGVQQALLAHANMEFMYRELERTEIGYAYSYADTPWDLFNYI